MLVPGFLYPDGSKAPIVFAFIAWMKKYLGATPSDIPCWAQKHWPGGRVATGGTEFVLGEVLAFQKIKESNIPYYFGDVQTTFNTRRLGGDDQSAKATVIWCAADPNDGHKIKVIGYYREATVFTHHQPREPALCPNNTASDLYPNYNVRGRVVDSAMFDIRSRPALPFVPGSSRAGRWQTNSKIWFGTTKPLRETKQLRKFTVGLLAGRTGREAPVAGGSAPILFADAVARYRLGQANFRKAVVRAYEGKCALTGCKVEDVLSACHIKPVVQVGAVHEPANGILLRVDLHLLFDRFLISIDPSTHKIWVSHKLRDSQYWGLNLKTVTHKAVAATSVNLKWHWGQRQLPRKLFRAPS